MAKIEEDYSDYTKYMDVINEFVNKVEKST